MAYLRKEDAHLLWDSLSERTWDALRRVVKDERLRPTHFSEAFASIVVREIDEIEQEGLEFPDSAEELEALLNDGMSKAAGS